MQIWSRIMPYKESFAWAIVPLFDNSTLTAISRGPASPSSPLTPSVSGSSSHDGVFEPAAKITWDGKSQAPVKLNGTNYLSWRLQFQMLFIGYDLQGYIDGTKPCPSRYHTTNTDNPTTQTLNPEYHTWIHQDQLILDAIIESITLTIILFIACATTTCEAWNIVAATYVTPSQGRIKQVKVNLKSLTKSTLSITDFLQSVKARADELAVLGASVDNEDLTDKILEELGDDYKELVRAMQVRDNAISFDELHEKLLMFEASLQATHKGINFSPTTHLSSRTQSRYPFNNVGRSTSNNSGGHWRPSTYQHHCYTRQGSTTHGTTNNNRSRPRPYLGYCQICGI
ncbi:hypothetical protein POTOM_016521 [Populus tomentosa]|uniref:Retrotransposon Copia-like N-terminal domain-containing protein n=1 Tax=Populus tomentosa TaxID=118781 RepID=A0A8X8D917_POPTO|nr:hypothetical protein POTOM_016521 [Populus tomentosa]